MQNDVSRSFSKLIAKIKVRNHMGLHTRPATELVKGLHPFKSQVMLTYKRITVNARSILGVLMLAAPKHAQIKAVIEGEDAEEVLCCIRRILEGVQ
jgi:phosphocarrier protein HPr